MRARELIGVFHADWGLIGTISYLFLQWTGLDRCALCDITHRGLFHGRDWRRFVGRLGIPVELYYRNRMPSEIAALGLRTPFVAARTDEGIEPLVDRQELEQCARSVIAFERVLVENASARNITIPIAPEGGR